MSQNNTNDSEDSRTRSIINVESRIFKKRPRLHLDNYQMNSNNKSDSLFKMNQKSLVKNLKLKSKRLYKQDDIWVFHISFQA